MSQMNNKSTVDTISTIPKSLVKGLCRGGNYDSYDGVRSYQETFLTRDIPGSSVLTQGSFWNLIIITKDKLLATRGLGYEEYEYDITSQEWDGSMTTIDKDIQSQEWDGSMTTIQ
jgi:hypothetical protein